MSVESTNFVPSGHPVIFYDGLCVMCNGFVMFMFNNDAHGVVRFAPQQGATFQEVLRQHPELEKIDSLVLVVPSSTAEPVVLIQSDASLGAMKLLGGFWGIVASIALAVPKPIRNFFYNITAANRYWIFGKHESCPIPPAPLRERLLP